jgi:aminomethyltransferase
MMPERRTPLYDNHVRLGAQMVKGGGDFMFPLSYTSPVEEHINTRTNVGMQDLSTMGEVDIKGPGAERLINHLLVNEIRDMHPGQARYSTMCREDGGVVDDITVYKFNDEHFMIVTSSGPRKKSARWIADHAIGTSTYVTDITAAVALPVVQGPRSREFLKSLVQDADLDALKFFRFAPARIGETELIISRSGYTGELGYELYTPAEDAGALWDSLLQSGRAFGLRPYGVAAMHTLRLEKAFPLYGNDINEDYTPFHVGLDRWIRFDKRDFVGREALLRVQERGLSERWVGLVLQGEIPAAVDAKVFSVGRVATTDEKQFSGPEAGAPKDKALPGNEEVGRVTYSNRGHTVGKLLALAYVRASHSWPGSRLLVEINGRPVPATVTPTPFFDPQGARLRAKA